MEKKISVRGIKQGKIVGRKEESTSKEFHRVSAQAKKFDLYTVYKDHFH